MRRGLLDTDMLSYYLKGVPQVVERAREYLVQFGALEFSVVSYYEMRRGLEWAGVQRKIAEFEAFVALCIVWDLDRLAAQEAARISQALRARGELIEEADILIAGTARARGLAVITHNVRHFSRIEDLVVEDWLAGE
jgi:tRNA(fMet)-specific endonuclease VapC